MLSLLDPMVKREIIMDHYENPRNRGLVEDSSYLSINMNSESCIDDLTIQLKVENGIIKDFRYDGVGCTISIASTSVLSELIIGETIEKAYEIVKNYDNMIKELDFDELLLKEAVVFKDVSKQANRIKCAMIGYTALTSMLDSLKG